MDMGRKTGAVKRIAAKRYLRSILWLFVCVFALACGPDPRPSVTFVEPAEGSRHPGPDVTVQLSASGIRITPASVREAGTAHHHLFLDIDATPPGEKIPAGRTGIIHLGKGDSTFVFLDVSPGRHRIIAVLGDSAHVPLEPLATDTVHVTVEP